MKRGFTLIELIVGMSITVLMILLMTTIILRVSDNFYSESEVVEVRNTLGLIEARFETIVRSTNGGISIYKIDDGYDTSGFDACYYYDSAEGRIEDISDGSPVEGFPRDLSRNYHISSLLFDKSSTTGNALKLSFYIQEDGSETETLYQDIVLSTLNPNINIVEASGIGDQGDLMCVNFSEN